MRDLVDLLFSLCGFFIMLGILLLFIVFGHGLLGIAVGILTVITSFLGVTLSLIISVLFPIILIVIVAFAIITLLKKSNKYF